MKTEKACPVDLVGPNFKLETKFWSNNGTGSQNVLSFSIYRFHFKPTVIREIIKREREREILPSVLVGQEMLTLTSLKKNTWQEY